MAENAVFHSAEFPSTLDVLGDAIQDALNALLQDGWIDDGQVFYARLCLEEAIVNAITHGNQSDGARKVRIEMTREAPGEFCCIRVCDEGTGFDPDDITLPPCTELNGRGICLIRHCMDSVNYDPRTHCLEMRMRRNGLCRGGAT